MKGTNKNGTVHEDPNKRNGVGSIMQINARSTMESEYMYDESNITPSFLMQAVFKRPYKQHTKFDKQPMVVYNDNSITDLTKNDKSLSRLADFGETLWFKFDTTISDLMGNLVLKFTLPDITKYGQKWTNDMAHAMIEEIKIINGDEELVKYTGAYLHVYSLLNTTAGKLKGVNHMTRHFNTFFSLSGKAHDVYVPIPFMETFQDKQYFPISIANMKTFQIIVKIRKIRDLVCIDHDKSVRCVFVKNGGDSVSIRLLTKENISFNTDVVRFQSELYYDAIHITLPERLLFITQQGELLYHIVKYKTVDMEQNSKNMNIKLDFNGTVSHLIVCMVPDCNVQRNLYFEYLPIGSFTLMLNGNIVNKSNDMNDAFSAERFRYNASRVPSHHIYTIPFGLSLDTTQPTGYHVFDGSSSNSLIVNRVMHTDLNCTIHIFAVAYKKMRFNQGIISGMS